MSDKKTVTLEEAFAITVSLLKSSQAQNELLMGAVEFGLRVKGKESYKDLWCESFIRNQEVLKQVKELRGE